MSKKLKSLPPNPTEKTFERLTRLSDVSMALSSGLELAELLKTLGKTIKQALLAEEVYFMLLENKTFELKFEVATGKPRRRPKVIKCPDRRTVMTLTF